MTTTNLLAALHPLAHDAEHAEDRTIAAAGRVLVALLDAQHFGHANYEHLNALAVISGLIAQFPTTRSIDMFVWKAQLEAALCELKLIGSRETVHVPRP